MDQEHAAHLIELAYASVGVEPRSTVDQNLIDCNVLVSECPVDNHWGWDVLSEIFHYGTRSIPLAALPGNERAWAEFYLKHCHHVLASPKPSENIEQYASGGIELPSFGDNTQFEHVLERRQTVRSFLDKPVPLEVVSHLLQFSLGFMPSREVNAPDDLSMTLCRRRCSPSGGGLNATEGYLYVNNVMGLAPGIYYYDSSRHALHLCTDCLPSLGIVLAGQHFANNLPVGLFLTSRFDKYWWKYPHSRAYRMALIEVGHIAQTFQLIATDQGLGTWLTGAMDEDAIEPLLKLGNSAEQLLFFVGAGFSDGSHTPKSLRDLMSARTSHEVMS
ncbi:SagB/ThcOx family dehydrogenase [Pseudomonas sp. HLMP]|uniref:SagB/ThcOx family dehydrogenase n=1 Tax=Pseudomonas sp. HLMP TaxID=3153767 RepID=UPI00396757EF